MDAFARMQTVPRRRARSTEPSVANVVATVAPSSVEQVQRARIILDVGMVDLGYAETTLGLFHPTTCHFRAALSDARRAWERLRAVLGTRALEAARNALPVVVLPLRGDGQATWSLVVIGGRTYAVEPMPGTPVVASLWRLTRLPPQPESSYYLARLRDGSTHCDCAEWIYEAADSPSVQPCKHLAALASLGWL
jgi:hypothetical protein